MKPLFISISGEMTTIAIITTVLAIFGVIALIRYNRLTMGQNLATVYNMPFPTGKISQIKKALTRPAYSVAFPTGTIGQIQKASTNPVYTRWFNNGKYASTVKPTGSVLTIPNQLPVSYSGPVVVEGSKYLWESRWSHLPSFEQGREGEERVVNTLVNTLGTGWFIFRNFVLPTENEDIDVVLVGPSGVFAMEVKAYSGEVKFERGRCYMKTAHGRMYRQRRGPVGQVRQSAIKLNSFFREQGIAGRNQVKPLIVMSGGSPIELASAQTDVCTLSNLRARLGEMTTHVNLTQDEVRELAGVLQMATNEQTRSNLSRVH